MYLKNRKQYKEDVKLEMLIEKLSISNSFKKDLMNIDHPLSNILIVLSDFDVEKTPYKQDNIDVSDRIGYLTFNNGKSEVKIGRFLNKLAKHLNWSNFTDNNDSEKPILTDIEEKDIQEFVIKYNNLRNSITNVDMVIIKGEKIGDVYKECGSNKGTLGNSCMIGKNVDIFSMYIDNPNQVSIATLWKGEPFKSELLGRSLLWNTDKGKFMDRIYFSEYETELKFKGWAKENGYFHRLNQNHHRTSEFIKDGKEVDIRFSVTLERNNDRYPYMDTLKFYDPNNMILYSYPNDDTEYTLEATNGYYNEYEQGHDQSNIENIFENSDNFVDVFFNRDGNFVMVVDEWSDLIDLFKPYDDKVLSKVKEVLDNNGSKDKKSFDRIKNSLSDYIGNFTISEGGKIHFEIDKISDRFVDMENYEEFFNVYDSYSEQGLLDLIKLAIKDIGFEFPLVGKI